MFASLSVPDQSSYSISDRAETWFRIASITGKKINLFSRKIFYLLQEKIKYSTKHFLAFTVDSRYLEIEGTH